MQLEGIWSCEEICLKRWGIPCCPKTDNPFSAGLLEGGMQPLFVPKRLFFTKGVGTHKEELRSFELALRDAKIEKCNLVQVSG